MSGARLYGFWGSLTEALRTGQPQNEAKTGGNFFGALYQDPARLRGLRAGDDRHQRRRGAGHRRPIPLGALPDLRRRGHGGGLPAGPGRARAPAPHRHRLRLATARSDL